jgi:hypothetical protein
MVKLVKLVKLVKPGDASIASRQPQRGRGFLEDVGGDE